MAGMRDKLASAAVAEDSPRFNWARDGDRTRGVTLTNGRKVNVNRGQFIRYNRNGRIDAARTKPLLGDPRPIKGSRPRPRP